MANKIQLDKWQHVTAFNFKVLEADYAVCYARLDPPFSTLVGYAGVTDPDLQVQEGNVEINSVGNWPEAIIPYGSENRSYPEAGNGKADEGKEGALATKLPSGDELDDVYLWHTGRSRQWGFSDILIVNVKKLREDYPDNSSFQISMASHTYYAQKDGDGDFLPHPEEYDPDVSPKVPLRMIVGVRTYVGDGGEWGFFNIDLIDPFGNAVGEFEAALPHYMGGNAEISASVEKFAAVDPITTYGQLNVFQLRGMVWTIDWKRPKRSELYGGPIGTQEP